MNTSEQINELAAAMAKAQGSIQKAIKDSNNPHFKSRYADLASVWDACRDALSGNGVAVIQGPGSSDDGAVTMTTRLIHSSGQWMETMIACRPQKPDAQGVGSTITYLRRFSLAAMVGVAPDDDDGEGAVGRGNGNGGEQMAPANGQRQDRQRPRQQRPPQRQDTPFDDDPPADMVEYVTSTGEPKPMPRERAIGAIRSAYRSEHLSDAAYKTLVEANAGWMSEDEQTAALDLRKRPEVKAAA